MTLDGKTALITGATGGLGERIAAGFYKEGASLLLHGRDEAALKALQAKFPVSPRQRIELFNHDILAADFLLALKKKLDASNGVDIVVNNAAEQGPVGKTWEVGHAAWGQTLELDLLIPSIICQLAIPYMIKRGGGKIINISGGGAATSRPDYSAYAVAKTGLVRFSECLSDEAREYKVDVNAVAPGVMPTRMHPDRTPNMPADPFAEPVALCVYLASPASNGVSGRLISAVWDDWRHLHEQDLGELYTLRRTVPEKKT